MAQDLNPSYQSDSKLETSQAQNRTRMYYLSSDSDLAAKRELLSWNKSLWVGLDQWSRKDEGNTVLYQAFKATYYHCLSGLEKYFSESKHNADDATILGLNIINQTIGKSVEKFIYLQPNSK